jgi:hypothetical protein
MSKALHTRIRKLESKSSEVGLHQLAAAAQGVLACPDDIDHHINLVGSLHEVGKLKNSIQPYWKAWRSDTSTWLNRCFARLLANDADYWALASLLGCPAQDCAEALGHTGLIPRSLRFYERFDLPDVHVAVFAPRNAETVWAPIIELGYDSETSEVVDACRWRAILWNEQNTCNGSIIGNGSGTFYMRARLPYGCWRVMDEPIELKSEWVVEMPPFLRGGLA